MTKLPSDGLLANEKTAATVASGSNMRQPHLSFGGVVDGRVKRVLCDAEGLAGDANPAAVQRLHRDLETHSGLAEKVLVWKVRMDEW